MSARNALASLLKAHQGIRLKDDGWHCCGCQAVVHVPHTPIDEAREAMHGHRADVAIEFMEENGWKRRGAWE
jgi:hypothetical protein